MAKRNAPIWFNYIQSGSSNRAEDQHAPHAKNEYLNKRCAEIQLAFFSHPVDFLPPERLFSEQQKRHR